MRQKNNRKAKPDHVRAVGQVDDTTVQVLQPVEGVEKYVWRIIRNGGKNVDSGMVSYSTIEEAMAAALQIVLPDAVPVGFREPSEDDFAVLNAMLFGFSKSGGIQSFQEALQGHEFLTRTLPVLQAALERMDFDYDRIAATLARDPDADFQLVQVTRSLQELAKQSQQVMIDLCNADLNSLTQFIQAFLDL
jgi:hypothetical protein